MDARDDGLLVLEFGALRGDKPEHDLLACGHACKRREAAGALVVELEEERVHVLVCEQRIGDVVVTALAGPRAVEVAAADMRVDAQVGGRGVEHAVVHAQQRFLDARKPRLVGAEEQFRLRVDEASPRAVVELQVAAARGVNLLDERQVGGNDIVFEKRVAFVRGISRLAVHGHDELLDELRRRRDRQLRCGALVLEGLDEAEVLDERVLACE